MANTFVDTVRFIGVTLLLFILLLRDPIATFGSMGRQLVRQLSAFRDPPAQIKVAATTNVTFTTNVTVTTNVTAATIGNFLPSCEIFNTEFKSNRESFLVDIHHLFTVENELEEPSLVYALLYSGMVTQEKDGVRHYLGAIREVSRLFEPALRQYIKELVPRLDGCVTFSLSYLPN